MIPKLVVTPVFEKNYDSQHKIVVNRGGTRSSKTYSLMQLLAFWLFTGMIGDGQEVKAGVASVVRKTLPSLKATAYRDFIEILSDNELYNLVAHNKSELTFTYGDRMVEFFSVDNQQKVRGRKREILIANEGNELDYKTDFYQLLFRTTEKVFIDFNPDDPQVWINTELEQLRAHQKGDVEVIVSNYKDNTFLSQSLVDEIEYLQQTDEQFWEVFGLGHYGKITGLIYPGWEQIDVFPNIPFDLGLDFGFTNDPTAIVKLAEEPGKLYVDEVLYERGLTNPEIAQRIRDAGLQNEIIYADSAEPKSIRELQDEGLQVIPAEKGPDSVRAGINHLKTVKVYVTTSSVNTWKERNRYKWKVDKEGNKLNVPIDAFNHSMDAIRYGKYTKWKQGESWVL